jgi:hypothetical protein
VQYYNWGGVGLLEQHVIFSAVLVGLVVSSVHSPAVVTVLDVALISSSFLKA